MLLLLLNSTGPPGRHRRYPRLRLPIKRYFTKQSPRVEIGVSVL